MCEAVDNVKSSDVPGTGVNIPIYPNQLCFLLFQFDYRHPREDIVTSPPFVHVRIIMYRDDVLNPNGDVPGHATGHWNVHILLAKSRAPSPSPRR